MPNNTTDEKAHLIKLAKKVFFKNCDAAYEADKLNDDDNGSNKLNAASTSSSNKIADKILKKDIYHKIEALILYYKTEECFISKLAAATQSTFDSCYTTKLRVGFIESGVIATVDSPYVKKVISTIDELGLALQKKIVAKTTQDLAKESAATSTTPATTQSQSNLEGTSGTSQSNWRRGPVRRGTHAAREGSNRNENQNIASTSSARDLPPSYSQVMAENHHRINNNSSNGHSK